MSVFRYRKETLVGLKRPSLFSYFGATKNLERILPPWLHFRVIDPDVPVAEGALLEYGLRLHGIPFHWTTRIEGWTPPERFIDVQAHGPYKSWVHEHRFYEMPKRNTLLVDTIDYEVPGGLFSAIAHHVAEHELVRIFDYREERLQSLFPPRR